MSLRAFADTVLSLLIAPPCAVCGRVLERPLAGAVCDSCWSSMTIIPASFSLRGIRQARAIGPYDTILREVIHALKYDGRRSVAPRLARLMAEHGRDVLRGADLAVPVPLHWRRQRRRGFNQAEVLARGVGLPVTRLLKRVRATPSQIELPAEARRENVSGAFALRTPRDQLRNVVIVLIDDVATTGATLDACARELRRAGARDIRALTAARVANALPQTRRG